MKIKRFKCRHCRRLFPKKVTDQKYCGASACQKARKNAWRREKYASDPDYRLNQKESTEAWLLSVGGSAEYYREYQKKSNGVDWERQEAKENSPSSLTKPSSSEAGDVSLFAGAESVLAENVNGLQET
jgi:hypothetical protein